jgi:hypothetical protein
MACQAVKERNRAVKGRTGRMTYRKRKSRGIAIKRVKTKLPDGTWESPQGIERSRA